jgi:glyoxylase-like metal-dependent hydrolase (beta-lactamase superfamily II)
MAVHSSMNLLFTRRETFRALLTGTAALALGRSASGQSAGLAATKLADNFTLIRGGGSNVLLLTSPDGNLLVDGGSPERSAELLKLVAEQTGGKPVRVLFNTHWHYDSTGSNETLGKAGTKIIAHENTKLWLGAEIDIHWTKKLFMPLPKVARPSETFYTTTKMTFGGQQIEAGYMLQAHTDSDIYVHFPQANILMVGDVVSPGRYPDLDWSTGGWITGMVEGQRALLAVATDDTKIIAGTGGVITKVELQAHFDKLLAIRDAMVLSFRKGKGGQDMFDEGLTKDYDAQWGDPKQFLLNAYRGMWGHVREVGGIV